MKMPKAALAAMIAGGAATLAMSVPADAQITRDADRQRERQQPRRTGCTLGTEGQRQYRISNEECVAIAPLLAAVGASDWPTARTALAAARAAASGADAKYVVGQAMLHIGIGTSDTALQSQAVDAILASGGAQPNELQALYEHQLRFALAARDTARAQQAQARLEALNPNDPARFFRQAQTRVQANDHAGAVPLILQAMQAAQAAGQPVPADWRRALAATAYQGNHPDTMRFMREWLTAAPGRESWHDTLAIFAERNTTPGVRLDIYRLMRAAGAMVGERDYMQYAEAANDSRAYGEVVAALQEGTSRNLITVNRDYARDRLAQAQTRANQFRAIIAQERQAALAGRDAQHATYVADSYFAAGQYAEAAELYRAALQRGADANTANTRIGAALALAGRRAEAETALGLVTGPRAELASLWRLWLSSRS